MKLTTLETKAVTYEFELAIEAPLATVWRCLTEDIDAWWLPDFRMVGPNSKIQFDSRAGGRLLEVSENGGSLLWYTVLMCVPQESIDMAGHMTAKFGGPSTTMLRLGLKETPTGVLLQVSDAIVGHAKEDSVKRLADGWLWLFRDGLKAYAEQQNELA